ncbi:hypothetical protein CYMTET_45988 [Cymbomonas tetramitiformis]|uniref:Uncharacterized protein n=1 Tax=Cymbomonas tetramitiformis TaxID=36881 RepID=A0AAE0BYA4_9CHLO|nr:hypothetical protein CYMTET_45988 [Cymbomonas tetramitiformis]
MVLAGEVMVARPPSAPSTLSASGNMRHQWVSGRSRRGAAVIWCGTDGTGMPCATCWRLWTVTTGHMGTDGVCIYSCTAAFALGRAPVLAPTPPAAPPPLSRWPPTAPTAPRANSLQELEPPLQHGEPQDVAQMSVRLNTVLPSAHGRDPPPASLFLTVVAHRRHRSVSTSSTMRMPRIGRLSGTRLCGSHRSKEAMPQLEP